MQDQGGGVVPGMPVGASGSTRVLALDAVRGMAILAVIATHAQSATVAATGSYAIPTAIFQAFDYGQFGVHLFFALSGWLMFSLYTGDRTFSRAVYWSRRWARIWPLWVIFLALSYWAWGVPDTGWPVWVNFVVAALFLGWISAPLLALPLGGLTIQQEMGHYLLFSLMRRRGVAFLAGTVIVGYGTVVVARFILSHSDPSSFATHASNAWLNLQLFHSWPFFLLGGAGCVLMRRWKQTGVVSLMPQSTTASVTVVVALALSMLTVYAQETPGYFVLGYVLILAGIGVVANQIPIVAPAMRSIGKYSYFMYFFHFWVLRWLENRYRDSGLPQADTTSIVQNLVVLFAFFVIALAISWAVGWVSWRVLEKRVLDFAHRRVPNPSAASVS